MSSTVDFYTCGPNARVEVEAATSEATYYQKEYAVDNNPDTAWRPTSTATQTLEVDLQEVISCDAYAVWIPNYTTAFGANDFTVNYSDDDISYIDTLSDHAVADTAGPIRIKEFSGGSQSHRWWQLILPVVSNVVYIGGFWLLKKYTVSQGNEYPHDDTPQYNNSISHGHGGRRFVHAINKEAHWRFNRRYLLDGTTEHDAIMNVYNDCRGRRWPLFVQEGATQNDAKFCYLNSDFMPPNESGYQIYDMTMRFRQIPYIRAGDSY
jgi:hypothetical protein